MKYLFSCCTFVLALCGPGVSIHAQAPTVTPANATPAQSAEIKEMQKLEDQWSDAIVKRDQYGLELLMSPLFVGISSSGEVTTRNQQVALLYQKTSEPLSMEQRVVSARMLGDVAVVNGTYILKHRAPTGNDVIEERGIFTHVFQKVRSNWVCINAQRTTVAEESSAKPKVVKKSSAELPFHVPFLHKGAESTAQPGSAQSADTAQQQQK